MRARGDPAVSEAVGTVLMIAMVIALAAVVYLFVGPGSRSQAPPPAMALSGDAGATPTDRAFTVSAISTPMHWSELSVRLDGAPMTYDETLSDPATYCVVLTGSACVDATGWSPATTTVSAGQRVLIHDAALSGKTLMIVVPDENAAILSVSLR